MAYMNSARTKSIESDMSPNEIHVGKLVEERIHEIGMSKAEFGRRISTSRQNVNTLLRKRVWDVEQLVSASKILNTNFFEPFLEVLGGKAEVSRSNIQLEKTGFRVTIEVTNPAQMQEFLAWWQSKKLQGA